MLRLGRGNRYMRSETSFRRTNITKGKERLTSSQSTEFDENKDVALTKDKMRPIDPTMN